MRRATATRLAQAAELGWREVLSGQDRIENVVVHAVSRSAYRVGKTRYLDLDVAINFDFAGVARGPFKQRTSIRADNPAGSAIEAAHQFVTEQASTGYVGFDFTYSLHADEIPAGLTVWVSDLKIDSLCLAVEVRDALTGEKQAEQVFVVGNLVKNRGSIQVARDGELLHPSTFIARCVADTLRELAGEPARDHQFSPEEIADYERLAAAVVSDFHTHSGHVQAAAELNKETS